MTTRNDAIERAAKHLADTSSAITSNPNYYPYYMISQYAMADLRDALNLPVGERAVSVAEWEGAPSRDTIRRFAEYVKSKVDADTELRALRDEVGRLRERFSKLQFAGLKIFLEDKFLILPECHYYVSGDILTDFLNAHQIIEEFLSAALSTPTSEASGTSPGEV